jgi:mannosyltransferase OCH1-like enzyme
MKILILLLPLYAFAVSNSLKDRLVGLLPSPLNELRIQKTTLQEVEKKIGKPALIEGEKHYWERDGLKYAIELSFKKNILQSVHFTFTGDRPSLDKAGAINTNKLVPYGKFLILKEKESELMIDAASKTIHTVKLL